MPALPPDRPGCPKAPGERRPLPDPAAIRLLLVPESAPPYDEEVPVVAAEGRSRAQPPRGAALPGQGGGLPPARSASGGAQDAPTTNRGTPATAPGTPAAPRGTPLGWPGHFAQVLAETLAGARPPRQIVPWTTDEALRRIQRLGPRLASEQRPRVRRVVTSLPAPDVMEMAVVVGFGPRVKALAVRLEHTRVRPAAVPGSGAAGERAAARWVCTAVEAA